jgi:pimeloyl-ACP methyl ester carboxylesterase
VRAPSRGLVGAAAGALALGAAVGLTAERYAVGRVRLRPDPEADERFFSLPADRVRSVAADDGTALHVEEVGTPGERPSVVLVHGYTQEMAAWHYQRKALAADGLHLVLYDQRCHGRSARGPSEHSTIDQLGRDLRRVLDECVPDGPVVLVGHSMGGMTVMALADAAPELFGPRVAGVALLGTSTGLLAEVTFGLPAALLPVTRRVLPWLTRGMRRRPRPFERTRRVGTDLAFLMARRQAFGSKDVSPALVELVERMTAATPVDVIAEFYDTFTTHDKLAALDVLHAVETLLLVGTSDLVTPEDHTRAMAQVLPEAELVLVEGAGHMVQLERAEEVNAALLRLVARADAAAPDAGPTAASAGR